MLTAQFPKLKNYQATSPATQSYNCIAWACGDNTKWWWPDPDPLSIAYWPEGVLCEETIAAFDALFASANASQTANRDLENGYLKIAIFAKDNKPTHGARQLGNGMWTSKLGPNIDIAHHLHELESGEYGDVVRIYAIPVDFI